MPKIVTQSDSYTIKSDNTVEQMFPHQKFQLFNKLWIYPGQNNSSGLLAPNSGTIYIGENLDGPKICTDALAPDDLPLKIELPVGETKALQDLLIYGTQGDGIWIKFWPA